MGKLGHRNHTTVNEVYVLKCIGMFKDIDHNNLPIAISHRNSITSCNKKEKRIWLQIMWRCSPLQRICSTTNLLVSGYEPRPLSLQVLLQSGGGTAVCTVPRQLQLQFPDFLLLMFTLSRLSVDTLLHLDQLGLDLLQLCTKLKDAH